MDGQYRLWESPYSVALENILRTAYPIWEQRRMAQEQVAREQEERAYQEQQAYRQTLFDLAQQQVTGEREALAEQAQRQWDIAKIEQSQAFQLDKLEQEYGLEEDLREHLAKVGHKHRMEEIYAREAVKGEKEEKPPLALATALSMFDQYKKEKTEWDNYQAAVAEGTESLLEIPTDPGELSKNVRKTLEYYGEIEPEVPTRKVGRTEHYPSATRAYQAAKALLTIPVDQLTEEQVMEIAKKYGLINPDGSIDERFREAYWHLRQR